MASSNIIVSADFGSLPTYVYPAGYDQAKLGLGPLMMQANDAGNEGDWIGPTPVNVIRPVETPLIMPAVMPDAITWSSTYDWVILADGAANSTLRRFALYTFNKTTRVNPWSFVGAITCTTPINAGSYANKGHRVSYAIYTTGTISVNNNSTSVTGSGTTWANDRIFAGSRIGFGTSDPTAVTKWYEISPTAAPTNTGITLTQAYLGANLAGANYVIEDLRILYVATNTTAANAGLYMVAGIRFENFTYGAFTVGAAGGVADRLRGVFWLSDGGASTNTICQTYAGIAIDARTDWTHQTAYCFDSTANARIQVVNFRAAMTLTSGRDSNSGSTTWQYNTGNQAIVAGAGVNALVLCTPGDGGGPRSGTKSLFFVTSTRWYSAIVSNVTTGSTTFLAVAGGVTEQPPGNSGLGSGATVTYTQSGTGLNTITASPVAAGTGYPPSTTIYLAVGGKGTGATANITATDGVITAVTMGAGGSAYPASATVNLYVTGGGGNGGIVSGSTNGSGVFTSIGTVVDGGTRYATTATAATSSGSTAGGGIVSAATNAGGAVSSFGTTPVVPGERYPGTTGAATTSCTLFAATGALNSIAYDSVMDRFIIFTTAMRHYVTKYCEAGCPWERIVFQDLKQINPSTMDGSAAVYPSGLTLPITGCSLDGMTYLTTTGLTNVTNFLYNVTLAADWEYTTASNCRVVLPVMDTSEFATFVAGYFNTIGVIGNPINWASGRTGTNLGLEPGAVRMSYRTSGISDDSGAWTLLDYSGLLGITATATIQVMLEFRTCIGNVSSGRVTRIAIEGSAANDTHFQFSVSYSDVATSKFAWRYCAAFDGTVPLLYIRVYDGITAALILSDDSVTQDGTWEKSTDGSSWGAFDTNDRTNETTYLRWTPVSDLGNVNALPVLGLS
jgi:hypothetical protein